MVKPSADYPDVEKAALALDTSSRGLVKMKASLITSHKSEALPMPTKMKPIKITEEQDAAIEPLVKSAGDKSFSDLVRRLLAQEAARLGVEWPDNMPTPDQNIRKAMDKRWTKDDTDTP
jgi:predicted CopG family antitoxin